MVSQTELLQLQQTQARVRQLQIQRELQLGRKPPQTISKKPTSKVTEQDKKQQEIYEKQLAEVRSAENEAAEWDLAAEWIRKGKPVPALRTNPSVYSKALRLQEQGYLPTAEIQQRRNIAKTNLSQELAKQGLNPVYKKGNIVGIEDIKTGTSYNLDSYQKVIQSSQQESVKTSNILKEFKDVVTPAGFSPFTNLPQLPKRDIGHAIHPYKDSFSNLYYNQGVVESTKQSANIIGGNVGQLFSKKTEFDFKNPLEPFSKTGKRESEIKSKQQSQIIKKGTVDFTSDPFKTFGELQKDVEIEKFAYGLEETKNVPVDYYSKTKQTGEKFKEVGEFGFTGGLLLTGAGGIALGIKEATKQEKAATIQLEKGNEIPLYPTYKEKDYISPLYFGTTGFKKIGAMTKISKQLIKEELIQLEKQPFKFKGFKIKGEEGYDIDIIKGTQKYNNLKTEVEFLGKTYKEKGNQFIVPEGILKKKTFGKFDWNYLGGPNPTEITAISEFDIGIKGTSFPLDDAGKIFGTTSKETLIPKSSTSLIWTTKKPTVSEKLAGKKYFEKKGKQLARQLAESTEFGGDIIKSGSVSVSKNIEKNIVVSRTGKLSNLKIDLGYKQAIIKGELKDTGITKIIYLPKDSGVKSFRYLGGKKTPLSKTFGLEDLDDVLSRTAKKPKSTFKETPPLSSSLSELERPKMVGGEGVADIDMRGVFSGSNIGENIFESGGTHVFKLSDDILSGSARKQTETIFKNIPRTITETPTLNSFGKLLSGGVNPVKIKERDKISEFSYSKNKLSLLQDSLIKDKTIFSYSSLESDLIKDLPKQKNIITFAQPQTTKQSLKDFQELSFINPPTTSITTTPKIKQPLPTPKIPFFFFNKNIKGRTISQDNKPYDVYIKSNATKPSSRWEKINKKPLNKYNALNFGSDFVDNRLNARFSIKPNKSKKKITFGKLPQNKQNYWSENFYKFRPYQIKKGIKKPLRQTYIEKSIYRLDKPNEVSSIQKEKRIKKRYKKSKDFFSLMMGGK